MTREFTGRHMALIMIVFFGLVLAVNLTMASKASSTFGGLVVENTYVASQNFNRWLDEADRQKALGWQATARRTASGQVEVSLANLPAGPIKVSAEARHPLGRLPDRLLAFTYLGQGRYLSTVSLPPGRWRLRLSIAAAGHRWRNEADLP